MSDLAQEAKAQSSVLRVGPVSPALTPAAGVFADESLNQLYGAIKQLSEVDRAVILLYLEEKSYQDIADIVGANPNNIGVRINRIKERLRRLLDGKDK